MKVERHLLLQAAGLAAFAAMCAGIAGCGGKADAPAAQADDPPADENAVVVRAEAAQIRTIALTVDGLGRCETLPQRGALLTAAIEGQVQRIAAKVGEPVKCGQTIV